MKYTAIRVYKDRAQILDHLIRLPLNDRYLRFCNTLSDEGIAKYVDRIDLRSTTGEACFAVYDDEKNVVGLCHIAPYADDDGAAEMALSVDEDYRKNGIGDVLFYRGILHCESLGIKKIYMNCLASNTPIQRLARRHGMKVTTDYGESVAALNLKDNNAILAFLESVQNDTMGLYDITLRNTSARWNQYLDALTSIAGRSAGFSQKKENE
jgi:RimJ/RimL family protein N-acetyltransferase